MAQRFSIKVMNGEKDMTVLGNYDEGDYREWTMRCGCKYYARRSAEDYVKDMYGVGLQWLNDEYWYIYKGERYAVYIDEIKKEKPVATPKYYYAEYGANLDGDGNGAETYFMAEDLKTILRVCEILGIDITYSEVLPAWEYQAEQHFKECGYDGILWT